MISYTVFALAFGILIVTAFGCFFTFPGAKWLVPYGLCASFSMGMLAYLWEPYAGSDLSRYFTEMGLLQFYGMSYFPEALYASTPLTNWLLYLIAQTGDYHLFPFVSAFATTTILVFVVGRQFKSGQFSSRAFFLTITAAVGVNGPLSILIGGRQHLAIALMLLALWYDSASAHRNPVVLVGLYCLPIMIHVGTVPLYLARLIVLFAKKKGVTVVVIASVVFALLSGPILNVLSDAGIGGSLLGDINNKFFEYQKIDIWDWRIHALAAAMVALLFAALVRFVRAKSEDEYVLVLLSCLVMCLCYVTNYHLMTRVLAFVMYGLTPVVGGILKTKKRDVLTNAFCALFLLLVVLFIAYQCISVINQWHVSII